MTKEERENALHCLKVMVGEEVCEECKLYGTTGTDHCEADCVRVAIEALKQEPTTKNDLVVDWESYKDVDGNSLDDLILDVIQRNFDCGNTYGYKVADEIIGLLPSVTPQEPRKGHWIKEESPFGWDGHSYQCSECGRSIHLDTEMEDLEDYPYCHCGAKMQEELILHGDSVHYEDIAFKTQIGRIHAFSEQDIVKSYLERLKRRMEARDDDNGGEPLNAVDRGYHWAYEHLCEEIDNLLSESEG